MYNGAILCVDDERMILDSLKSQLNRAFDGKYLIEITESADEALEILEEFIEDKIESVVIVSDWMMPGMKGDEFLIKALEILPSVSNILLTGQADNDAIENAKNNANLHKLIFKPWDVDELVDAIQTGMKG
ncbi:response regulator [Sulfurimonas sp. SAG-AH-194-I05]|nr:response regulator [Sulfurimonas sp. SAG-AH-194-I05]MDF1875718.1 response regulator [Sulfurimonas sp. SAG-AH-194-I05]